VRPVFFVAPLLHRSEKVCIDSVEVDVLAEIQFIASEAESDEIVQQRLCLSVVRVFGTGGGLK
jgi:hypothetical protein